MTVSSILSVATNSLQKNANIVADASSKIVQLPVKQRDTNDVATVTNSNAPAFDSQTFVESHEAFSDHDLLTQVMRIKTAEVAYRASGSLVRTADEMSRVVLETIS